MNRDNKRLEYKKGKTVKTQSTFPNKDFGGDGDQVYVVNSTGTFLCIKINGRWYKQQLTLI